MTGDSIRGAAVLVTGGCGFIGSHLVRALVTAGAARIVVLDSLETGDAASLEGLPESVSLVRHRLGWDPTERLTRALSGVDFVLHLAALKHNASRQVPLDLLTANVHGTYALLEAAARAEVRKLVYASSLYAYGRTRGAELDEAETPRPTTVYGVSKLAGEHLLGHARERWGLASNALRYFFVYGPGQYQGTGYKSVIVKNFEHLLRGEPVTVHGDGAQVLDYVYVDDAVDASLRALVSPLSGETWNVGSGEPTRIEALVARMVTVSGRQVETRHLPPDETAGSYRVARSDRIREALEWSPAVELDVGLARTWAWIKATQGASR